MAHVVGSSPTLHPEESFHDSLFFCKSHFVTKKARKLLHISIKSSTFAPAFENEGAAGSSSARLECLLWEQEVVSSNLAYPTESRLALFL